MTLGPLVLLNEANYNCKVTDSVSKKTSVVVYGRDAGSKLEKAQKLAVSPQAYDADDGSVVDW